MRPMTMTEETAIQIGKGHAKRMRKPRTPLQAFGALRVLGLAMDEALLATAMVGSVGVFGAVTIPWDEIFVGPSAQVQTQLEEIEDANERFYHRYGRWPFEMTNGNAQNNAAALVTQQALRFPYSTMGTYRPMLKDIPYDVRKSGVTLRHSFAQGGVISQRASTLPGYKAEIVLEGIPFSVLQDLDKKIDGETNLESGRVQQRITNGGRLDLVYYANVTALASR